VDRSHRDASVQALLRPSRDRGAAVHVVAELVEPAWVEVLRRNRRYVRRGCGGRWMNVRRPAGGMSLKTAIRRHLPRSGSRALRASLLLVMAAMSCLHTVAGRARRRALRRGRAGEAEETLIPRRRRTPPRHERPAAAPAGRPVPVTGLFPLRRHVRFGSHPERSDGCAPAAGMNARHR
jgi:hypothetical protein